MLPDFNNIKIAVVGLGYVGLPLAVEFANKFDVIGYDINSSRIDDLQAGIDSTLEVTSTEITGSDRLQFSMDIKDITDCNVYIVTVPTPIDKNKSPDLSFLELASKSIGKILKSGDVVIYESTVYPGVTEEICVPILSEYSALEFNKDYYVGYSPERINPGDKSHKIIDIKKITSGSNDSTATFVDNLYQKIIIAGTHKTSSIKIAEAAKIIENTQRDINIALINELSIIFKILDIDTEEVLEAASTKWNFVPFKPGLVGGHCIGVDPYYLTYKASQVGYSPKIILAGRELNDSMANYVANQVLELMSVNRIHSIDARVLILGLSFKENCPDLRNTKVVDIINSLVKSNCIVDVYDPWVDPQEAQNEYAINLLTSLPENTYSAIIIAVAHQKFLDIGLEKIKQSGKDKHVVYDVKYLFKQEDTDSRL